MIGHREAQALISARLDGPLDPVANRELSDHLAACPECHAFAEQMHMLSRGLRDIPLLPPSPTVRRAVYDHIENKRPAWSWLPVRGKLAPMAVAALLALVVTGTVMAFALPRFQGDDAVRIGAPIFENRTTVDVASVTETSTLEPTATPRPAETATATATPEPTAKPTETEQVPTARATLAIVFATETATPVPADTATATLESAIPSLPPVATATGAVIAAEAPSGTPVPWRETATPESTATGTATVEPSATASAAATATNSPTTEPTETVPPTATETATPEPTATRMPPTPTATDVPTATSTPEPPTATATDVPTETVTPTLEATATATATATELPPTPTATPEPTATLAPPTVTATDVPTETATPAPEPTATQVPPTETATDVPTETATMTPEPTIGAAGAPTIAPRGGAQETETEAPSRSVRSAREDTPPVMETVPSSADIEPGATDTPTGTATGVPATDAVDEPTPGVPSPTPTCEPAGDAVGEMPTIAPRDGANDLPQGEESDCAVAATATAAAEATFEDGDQETGIATSAATSETETAAIVESDAPTPVSDPEESVATAANDVPEIAPTESLDAGEPATETPALVVPDVPTEVATEPAEDGVIVPSGGTEAALGEETPDGETDEADTVDVVSTESTGVDGLAAAELVLAGLPTGNAAGGPLPVSPDGNRFVLGANGEQRWIVGFDGSSIPISGNEVYYAIWSPDGRQLLVAYYPDNSELTSLGVVDAATGQVTAVTSPEDEGPAHRDVPGGWLGETAVYQRTYPDRPDMGVELWRLGDEAPFWSMEGVEVLTNHPIPFGSEFLIATSAGWLAIDAGGGASNLGPVDFAERVTESALGGGMIAYARQGQLVIAPTTALGSPSAVIPYSGGGFDWAPDGTRLVIAGGASLTFITPDGTTVATLTGEEVAPVVAPYWSTSGIRFIDSASAQMFEIPAPPA
jgi:predicted anti-sigma-YlaC factor YlaD